MNFNARSFAIAVGRTCPDGEIVPMAPEEKAAFSAEVRKPPVETLEAQATRMQASQPTHTPSDAWVQGLLHSLAYPKC